MSSPEENLYPNNGEYFGLRAPRDQEKEVSQEKQEAYSHIKLLREMVERLKERISFYRSIESINDDVLLNPEEFMHTVAANKLTSENLQRELAWMESLISEHVK